MKSRKPNKLKLNRETVRSLDDSSLLDARGGFAGGNLSIPVCTGAISDCVACTGRLDSCPEVPPGGGGGSYA